MAASSRRSQPCCGSRRRARCGTGGDRGHANLTGGFHCPDPDAIVDRLLRQVSGTVRWRDNMEALRPHGARVLEIGPAAPLRGFFRTVGVAVEPITSVRALARLDARRTQPGAEAAT